MTDPRRLQLGFYMYAPRLGGAERYLRDLLWGVHRDRFDVTLFAPPWRAFDRFVGLDEAPPLRRVDIHPLEPGTRINGTPEAVGDEGFGQEAPMSRLRRASKRVPLGDRAAPAAQWALRQAYWGPDQRRLTAAFATHGLDVLHSVNGGYPASTSARAAIPAAARAGVPRRILTVCSTPTPRIGLRAIEAALDHRVNRASTAVIVPARRPKEALIGLRGFDEAKVHIVPWGVDAPTPPADRRAARLAARAELGISGNGPLIGTLGNFTPTKGQRTVVEAIPALLRRFADVECLVAGEGPEKAGVEALARTLGLADSVRFPGTIESAFTFLRALDVFILASEIEGLPLVILEALSQGVPVVATDVGGIPEAVVNGTTGFLVPPGDPGAIANAVAKVLGDAALAATMSNAGRQLFAQRFSLDVMLAAHEALYEKAAM